MSINVLVVCVLSLLVFFLIIDIIGNSVAGPVILKGILVLLVLAGIYYFKRPQQLVALALHFKSLIA